MKKLASLLISLFLSFSLFAGDPPVICNNAFDIETNLVNAFNYGQETGSWECWRKAVNRLVASQVQSRQNPTTTLLDIAQNDDLTTEQKLDRLCGIFKGLSFDLMQTRGIGFRLDGDLKATGLIFCEKFKLLQALHGDCDQLCTKVIDIGGWDMSTDANAAVPHGLSFDYKNIRSIDVIIRDDSDTFYSPLLFLNLGTGVMDGGINYTNTTNVNIVRLGGGGFDNTGYSSTNFNRGFVTILYEK